jgi:hypothetical protein
MGALSTALGTAGNHPRGEVMIIDTETLTQRLTRANLPEPPAEEIDRRLPRIHAAMLRYGYTVTPASDTVARHIAAILAARASNGAWREPRAGLALYGPPGTGKTTALLIIAAATGAEYVAVSTLAGDWAARGPEWLAWAQLEWRARDLVLDDIGTPAEVGAKAYGAPLPIAAIIDARYDVWRDTGKRLYVSSNLSETQRNEAYDGSHKPGRTADRMGQMMQRITCAWGSFRAREVAK